MRKSDGQTDEGECNSPPSSRSEGGGQQKIVNLYCYVALLHSQNRATRQIASAGIHKTAIWKRL